MINCPNCGTENPDGTNFCINCGSQLSVSRVNLQKNDNPAPQQYGNQPVNQYGNQYGNQCGNQSGNQYGTLTGPAKVLGLISMICGIVSLCSCYAGFPFAIAAMILSKIAGNKAPGADNPKARLGKTLGIIGLIVSIVCLVAYIIIVAAAASSSYYYY